MRAARPSGEQRAYETLHERRALQEERALVEERARQEAARRFTYRETGGGYGGYGGRADRGTYRPEEGRFGAGYSEYGAARPWERGGEWQAGEGARGGETWRGGEFRGGREHWRGAEFRGGGAETWRRRGERSHPRGLGATEGGRRMERGAGGSAGSIERPYPTDKPHGLGAYGEDRIPAMEVGTHPGHPGADTVQAIGAGMGGLGGMLHGGASGRGGRDFEAEELEARRVGPGAFRREGGAGGRRRGAAPSPDRSAGPLEGMHGRGYATWPGGDTPFERGRPRDAGARSPGYVGEHRGTNWEGRTDAERMGTWFGGGGERRGWTGSGPGSERTSDWYGGSAGREQTSTWYGGGVHEAREDRISQDFGGLGGPEHGRFGREETADRGGGRGFGGPLGRWRERDRGEQGPLYGGQYRGREDEYPMSGEAYAGRGHVGSEDYRDLTRYGEGGADRGSRERYVERHEEGEHYRGR